MDCQRFRDQLYAYQADELSASERQTCQEHLNACVACADRLEIEDGLLAGLKARLVRTEAPPGLETRIRASLAESSGGRIPVLAWWRRPWLAAALASAVVAVALIPSLGLSPGVPGPLAFPSAVFEGIVSVVDIDCHRMGKTIAQQRACTHPYHVNGLRQADGTVLNLDIGPEAGRRIALDPGLRGHRLALTADRVADRPSLSVREYRDLGMGEREVASATISG